MELVAYPELTLHLLPQVALHFDAHCTVPHAYTWTMSVVQPCTQVHQVVNNKRPMTEYMTFKIGAVDKWQRYHVAEHLHALQIGSSSAGGYRMCRCTAHWRAFSRTYYLGRRIEHGRVL
jgi:hypothetical protein